jgi:hypothetical protein
MRASSFRFCYLAEAYQKEKAEMLTFISIFKLKEKRIANQNQKVSPIRT